MTKDEVFTDWWTKNVSYPMPDKGFSEFLQCVVRYVNIAHAPSVFLARFDKSPPSNSGHCSLAHGKGWAALRTVSFTREASFIVLLTKDCSVHSFNDSVEMDMRKQTRKYSKLKARSLWIKRAEIIESATIDPIQGPALSCSSGSEEFNGKKTVKRSILYSQVK